MKKVIYFFSILLLFILIFGYLAKAIYYSSNFKENNMTRQTAQQNDTKTTVAPLTAAPTPAPTTTVPITPAPTTTAPITPAPTTTAPITPSPTVKTTIVPTTIVPTPPITTAPTYTPAPTTNTPAPTISTPAPTTTAPKTPAPTTNMPYKFDVYSKNYRDISNNLDVVYHDDYVGATDDNGAPAGTTYVIDNSGNKVAIPPTGSGTPVTYYKPQDYVYGSLSYVPTYEDSVFLSRTSNMNVGKAVVPTSSIKGGICNFYKNSPNDLENACQNTDPDVCASTSCCVLLGGAKCVSGNDRGPTMKSHYSDTSIPNRDFYYYQSKCYGNCPR